MRNPSFNPDRCGWEQCYDSPEEYLWVMRECGHGGQMVPTCDTHLREMEGRMKKAATCQDCKQHNYAIAFRVGKILST